jgi:hypothetical protein
MYIFPGVFRASVVSEKLFVVRGLLLEGTCNGEDEGEFIQLPFSPGQTADAFQSIFQSEGCMVLWETSEVTTPYTITFEQID